MTPTDALRAARACIQQDRTAFADCNVRDDGSFEELDADTLAEYDAVLAQIDEALREDAMQQLADIGQEMGGYDVPKPVTDDRTQPAALRLADELETPNTPIRCAEIAAELRRLHAENERLRAILLQCGEAMICELGGEPLPSLMI